MYPQTKTCFIHKREENVSLAGTNTKCPVTILRDSGAAELSMVQLGCVPDIETVYIEENAEDAALVFQCHAHWPKCI